MTILIEQLPVEIQADETNIHHTQNQKELVLGDGFAVPQTNAFGHNFRDYTVESARQQGVEFFYKINHFNQTYDYVRKMRVEYAKLDKAEMSIWECCELLNDVVDDSDPDLDEPQIQHLLQSAEAIRKDYPDEDWLHLTALIHEIQADETNIHHAQNQKELVLVDGFAVPQTNAFGHNFRDYTVESARHQGVEFFYKINHFNQTYDYVSKMKVEYAKLDKAEMSIWECCELLNDVVDDSDPDLDELQIQHSLQSAEAIRKANPNEDWLHLTALIHDLGKVLLLPSFGELPQWAVVGDTFPVGCAFHDSIVHSKYFKENPDYNNPAYNNKFGVYSEDCINLKHKIQDLIDPNVVSLQTVAPNVNSNPLPNHGGATINMIETDDDWCVTKAIVPIAPDELERVVASLSIREKKEFVILTPEKVVALVSRETLTQPKFVIEMAVTQGMTRSGRCYTSEELAQGSQKKDQTKRPISEAEAEEFWRKMQPKDYSIVKHLEKTPAQISVWALLMSSQLHRQALMKALDDTYVPVGTNSDNLASMINQVIRGHRISFCDEELPFEGRMHNKALHVTTMCQDKIINRVLVDDGSGLNICPLSTLRQLKFDVGKLHQNQVNVRAFDGVQRDTLGAVNLDIQVGPAEFNVEFQVLDIDTSYNLLLGRPFIHMAGAVPSTLHQLMKFVWKDQELVIYGEGSHSNGISQQS